MKKAINPVVSLMVVLILIGQLQAVTPKKWEIRSKEDFLRGKFSGVTLSSEGILSLGPKVDRIDLPPEEFYLSLAFGPGGVIYVGTGHNGRIYRLGEDRKAELYYQAPEVDVTCLAVDQKGNLLAGTSPNGKIYRISAKGKGDEFFNPQEKYIWDLKFNSQGNLLVAVGENAGIYEITPTGEGKQIFKTKDNHVLCLKLTSKGDILAGSGGRGLLYKISGSKSSVLFESPYDEIRSIELDTEGNIYLTTSGQPSKSVPVAVGSTPVARTKSDSDVSIVVSASQVEVSRSEVSSSRTAERQSERVSGAVFQVSPEGLSRKLWSSSEEMPFSLVFDKSRERIIFATGNQGRLYAVNKNGDYELLTQETPEQLYALYELNGKYYVIGNNPALLGILLPEGNLSGNYLSPVLEAGGTSIWGSISWEADLPAGTTIQVQSRSGNSGEPDDTWSDWSPPYARPDEKILSPAGRYLQLRVNLKAQAGQKFPAVQKLVVFYQQLNLAPVIEKVEVLPANQVYIKPPEQEEIILGLEKASAESAGKKEDGGFFLNPKKSERQGFRTITWEASDDNNDKLNFNVYIRPEKDKNWYLMADGLTDKIISFDTRHYPDGTYFIKIEASDLPANPPGTEKKVEKISRPVVIDNSLPEVKNFVATKTNRGLEVSFSAVDKYSYIEEVKYLVRPDDWQVVFPIDGLCDSTSESFKFNLNLMAGSDNLMIIRVKDSFGNIGVYQYNF
ncbi:MAG TPA: WD40 repeat domain-containing protein [Candidatus Saccharicenans sp.]|nr:WD40 repeat domain-containing protein [Candidatus Saccharicenans sp.]